MRCMHMPQLVPAFVAAFISSTSVMPLSTSFLMSPAFVPMHSQITSFMSIILCLRSGRAGRVV